MVNTSKIRGRMVQLGISNNEAASALNLSVAVTVKKLNNLSVLNLAEAETLAALLEISDQAFGEYFFA
ncbi:XRE family transcriptional regulator [Fumia xinanensis]|uniref:XRE family transcriptional regulator n=1 Tax=Fumia xinanensis TaxID=2763659 RepID=A0A926I6A3_9FIRM|nr:XRE family transcriptional regulator [Fumia xinanensis]MBC8559695.1 XRE family transcriptional regulator [Fumia xinanensis]PWL45602.1 MAG: XRE family transcriptional regulator [Clostridiales bacterium]